jgi:acetoacetyl-CoA synthetase
MTDKIPLFVPELFRTENSNFKKYFNFLKDNYSLNFIDYTSIYNWSIDKPIDFWKSLWEFADFAHIGEIEEVCSFVNPFDVKPGAKWFTGIQMNFAENLLRFRNENIAIKFKCENGFYEGINYNQLYSRVANLSDYLFKNGVCKGDVVAGFITNIPDAIIAMLATTSIGAIWTSCSPDFGLNGVLDRFTQVKPKILFALESYYYNGKKFDLSDKIASIKNELGGQTKVILVNYPGENHVEANYSFNSSKILNIPISGNEIDFLQSEFSHPVYIMYSSGTTGKPKCIVHSAGGTLLQHYKELFLHTDLKENETIMYFTTTGWMMWNWLVSSLSIGASVFLYDGSPSFPDLSILWKYIDEYKINIFGTSPKFLSSCEQAGIVPRHFDLNKLKSILSTGSPLSENNFKWVYDNVKTNLLLSSIAGGTDIISCFMLGNPLLPVFSEEIQCRGLGMKVECLNENSEHKDEIIGELVCSAIFPSMPIYFWNDEKNELFNKAYFEHYPGKWRHGDFIKITQNGGVIVYGRSDSTLNPGGVRIGTSEIYRVIETLDFIIDSMAVGKKEDNDISVVLFVHLKKDVEFNSDLSNQIKSIIRKSLTPRHVPKYIIPVNEIPVTMNNKKVEITVTRIINNEPITNQSALLNQESINEYYNIDFDNWK